MSKASALFLSLILFCFWGTQAHGLADDLCPRLEGVDLGCAPIKPPIGGGGGSTGEASMGCSVSCTSGYNCPGDGGPGGGGGDGDGDGDDGVLPNPPKPVDCIDSPITCTYVRDGSLRTIEVTNTTQKVTCYKCREIAGGPETPPTYTQIPQSTSCKSIITMQCYIDSDRMTKPGTINTCTGMIDCPTVAGYTRVTSAVPCPTNEPSTLPLCDSLVMPLKPPCPPVKETCD